MSRRHAVPRWSLACIITMLLSLVLTGCPADEFDPQTWIDKLDDPTELDEAITRLQRLKEPVAIKPLAKAWEENNRPQRILKVIIDLAGEEKDGKTHWEDALPVLRKAIDDFDVGDAQSMENAKLAAEALGRAKDKDSIQSLVSVANKQMPKLSAGQEVRRSAIIALGQFGDDQRSVDALVGVLNMKLEDQPVELFAAAANALADARSPKAIEPLLKALFNVAPIYQQCRRALIAIGKPVIPELIKIFKNEHKQINKLAEDNKFNIDCNKEMGPESNCKAPTNLQFKSAALLGDMYAKEAVEVLAAGLEQPAQPAFFDPASGVPGPTQHEAILDALRKINDDSSTPALSKYWKNPNTSDVTRPFAIDVYSMVSTTTDDLPALAKLIKDDSQEEAIRMAAGMAYSRLVQDAKDYEPITFMINRYKKEADKNEGPAQKAKAELEKVQKEFEAASKAARQNASDKKLAEALQKAQAKLDEKLGENDMAQGKVAGYRGFQRAFEQNLARAHIGVTCKKDPKCYADILDKTADDIAKGMKDHITDYAKWLEPEKLGLKLAATERALIELTKLGDKARATTDTLLKHAGSTERIVRQGVLLAMVQVAALPCEQCVKRLDEIIKTQEEQSTLAALTADTKAVRNYFLWAGSK